MWLASWDSRGASTGRARLVRPSGLYNDSSKAPTRLSIAESERKDLTERAAHIREALTGYRSGTAEMATAGEPRAQYDPHLPLTSRYAAKGI